MSQSGGTKRKNPDVRDKRKTKKRRIKPPLIEEEEVPDLDISVPGNDANQQIAPATPQKTDITGPDIAIEYATPQKPNITEPEITMVLPDCEPLPKKIDDKVSKPVFNKLPEHWKLDNAYCYINKEEVSFIDLLKEYGIVPNPEPLVNMKPHKVPWTQIRASVGRIIDSFLEILPQILTADDKNLRKKLFNSLEDKIFDAIANGTSEDEVNRFLPDLYLAQSWGIAVQPPLPPSNAYEQDFTVDILGQYFSPFLKGLEHKSCSHMPLPSPFEKLKRRPDARAFVNSTLKEFIFFLREDSPVRTDSNPDLHKDLHKIVQLMRCALRLQTLMLSQDYKAERTLYCFGILCNGYKLQLLQMSVHLMSPQDYTSPEFHLSIDPELLDLDFSPKIINGKEVKVPNKEIHSTLTRLLNWLSVIRSYGFYLKHMLDEGIWQINTKLFECQTNAKIPLAASGEKSTASIHDDHEGAKKDKYMKDKDDDDNNSGGPRGQPSREEVQRQLQFASTSTQGTDNKNNSNTNEKKGEVQESVMTEIMMALEDKRYRVLHESTDKKVVILCTFSDSIRAFAVKIFGAKSGGQLVHEIEVMKQLGKHPNIGEILATATLKTGEFIAVQPYYHDTGRNLYFPYYCKVFLQLAKGLAHIHERGVIHGDIKPSNMIVKEGPHVRIIDFDYSLRVGVDGRDQYAGTPGFRAPELKDKKNDITPMIDIWSLAMTMTAGLTSPSEETNSLTKRQLLLQYLADATGLLYPFKNLLEKMLDLVPANRPTALQVQASVELIMQDKEYSHILEPVIKSTNNKENESGPITSITTKSPKKSMMRNALKDVSNLVK